MFGFRRTLAQTGARACLPAAVIVAVMAISGLSAGSAMAGGPPTCPNKGAIKGRGSSLQKEAQSVWTGAYNLACAAKPLTAEYTVTSSGSGLETFRFTGAGAINHEFQFIGTDDAPNGTQIEHSVEVAGGALPIVVPVTQTAIAIDIHPPTGCKFKAGKGITWTDLNKIWGGKGITKWRQITNIEPTTEGGACDKAIIRVVRKDASGTTYQFKNYLSTLETTEGIKAEKLPCVTEGHEKWGELKEVGAGNKPNITWPCPPAGGGTTIEAVEGGGALAAKVVELESSIGYTALPDSKAKGATVALLQNATVAGEAKFAEPGKEEVKEGLTYKTARCENARYEVPAEARTTGSGEAVDWSAVFGAVPKIGGTEYPLCTLTYDVGWNNYVQAGYETEAVAKGTTATAWGEDVADYIKNYVVVPAEGQKAIREKWYSTLPTGGGVESLNVQMAAEYAATKLGNTTGATVWSAGVPYGKGAVVIVGTTCYKAKELIKKGEASPPSAKWETLSACP